MNTEEVAQRLYDHIKNGNSEKAVEELYGEDIVSIEPEGTENRVVEGIEAVKKKSEMFYNQIEEIHSTSVSEPICASDYFSFSMSMDLTFKNGHRLLIDEICVYKVRDGKIVREEFFFEIPSN